VEEAAIGDRHREREGDNLLVVSLWWWGHPTSSFSPRERETTKQRQQCATDGLSGRRDTMDEELLLTSADTLFAFLEGSDSEVGVPLTTDNRGGVVGDTAQFFTVESLGRSEADGSVATETKSRCGKRKPSNDDSFNRTTLEGALGGDVVHLVSASECVGGGASNGGNNSIDTQSDLAMPPVSNAASEEDGDRGANDGEKKRRRLERNRESARLSRERRREQVDRLEDTVKQLTSDNTSLAYTVTAYHAELRRLTALLQAKDAGTEVSGKATTVVCPSLPLPESVMNKALGGGRPERTETDKRLDQQQQQQRRTMPQRDIRVKGEPAELTELPSILPLMAVFTLVCAMMGLCHPLSVLSDDKQREHELSLNKRAEMHRQRTVWDETSLLQGCHNQNSAVVAIRATAVVV